MMHPGSHPPSQPPSVANAAGQMMQPLPQAAKKSNKALLFGVIGVLVVGGGVAAAVALGGGGDSESAQSGGPTPEGGTAVATGAPTPEVPVPTPPNPDNPIAGLDTDDITDKQLEAIEKQLEAMDDPEVQKALLAQLQAQAGNNNPPITTARPPQPPPTSGGNDAFSKKLAAFSSGVPACDAYVRLFAALIDCPALATARDAYQMGAEQMMDGLGQFKKLDAKSRRAQESTWVQTCQQGADALKQAGQAMGCKIDPKLIAYAENPPPPAPAPPDDVKLDGPYDLQIAGFNAAGFDYMKWLPTATAEARKHFPDAKLARIDAEGVGPDGLAHLSVAPDDFSVLYRFTSPAAAKKPADHPAGLKWEPRCMVQIIVEADETTVIPMQGFGCEPAVPMPKCNAKQVWQKAVAKGAPGSNAYAELWYGYAGGKWSFDIDEVFDDTFDDGC